MYQTIFTGRWPSKKHLPLFNNRQQQVQTLVYYNFDKFLSDVKFYVSKQSKNIEVVVSRAKDSMLLIEEEDDFAEYPIPEQFKIKYENRKLDVKHVDHI